MIDHDSGLTNKRRVQVEAVRKSCSTLCQILESVSNASGLQQIAVLIRIAAPVSPTSEATAVVSSPKASDNSGIITAGADRITYW